MRGRMKKDDIETYIAAIVGGIVFATVVWIAVQVAMPAIDHFLR